ncbi:MAG: Protein DedA [Phycisphaerae bacterium]|nr:Protein DedA [Phycisphaerae bacterium]
MEVVQQLIDFILHFDQHLDSFIRDYGAWTYLILTLIVFAETGLVFTPILPGDTMLFTAGALSGTSGSLRIDLLWLLLSVAAIAGDTVNYWIGKYFGQYLLKARGGRLLKKEHLDRTHYFFEKYGGKTIILARFIPIVRTFAPFVAGLGAMTYSRFLIFNIAGGLLWVTLCLAAGYFFGGLEIVRKNFSLVVLGIIFVSVLPLIIEVLRARRGRTALPPVNPDTGES